MLLATPGELDGARRPVEAADERVALGQVFVAAVLLCGAGRGVVRGRQGSSAGQAEEALSLWT